MNRQNIELHIEEMVLHGLENVNRRHVADAMERELTHLLSEQGLHPSISEGGKIKSLKQMEFNVTQGSSAEYVGIQVARTLFGGLKI